jgi:hypothetical protein
MDDNEKIVPLNEDLNSHVHDEASWQKVKQSQENDKKQAEKTN